ncbi:zinc-dependent alcohol dehydrogenase [Actinocatenispora comari]|uniref:Galactitol-1-phosphate 5-dehydrogenase n=1 Tax=Actinocatenispora comari TaxID=2807577 RepID=A0A8J4EM02_9ACTN|nr:alcohol dehydrogenase catalytic domain-containing protein [Actinocatenispora comari]GIL28705.1 galactitol-1-phosphate 5-dehydrogenase [Actinocatenispora comari]
MRALVLDDFWSLTVERRPDPVPGPGEVVLRIAATGICGSDLHGFTGDNGRRRPGQVMGHETAGTVESVGAGVDLAPGTQATAYPVLACGECAACRDGRSQICANRTVIGVEPSRSAAFADRLLLPAANVVALPAGMPLAHGALVEPLSVGYHAARRGVLGAADRVLILGGGPIGQAVALAAARLGAAEIVVTEPDPGRRALVDALGVATVEPGRAADALSAPASVAIDAVGVDATMAEALAATEPGARIVLVGMGAPRLDLAAYPVSTGERSLIGSFCYTAEEFAATAAWAGTVPELLAPLISAQVPLAEAPDAFTRLARDGATASKILVRFDEEG